MCGLCGFTGAVQDRDLVLENMTDVITHRGPDSVGYYKDDSISMGFRRLSIIDLEQGHQPIYNEDKSLVLMFNGEIYNYRELREELGAEVEILCKLGVVSDYYNLIHRHNFNHYFLCRAVSFGNRHLTEQEIEDYHLSTLKLRYEAAIREYELRSDSMLGRLIANRELPVLKKAQEWLDDTQIDDFQRRNNDISRK